MSIEISVLSDIQLSTVTEWQGAIDAEEFPLQLTDAPLDQHGGSLTGLLCGNEISIEYRVEDFGRLKEFYKKVNFGRDWKCLLAIPWIRGIDGLTTAWMAATAYARATEGVVFDPQEGKVFNSSEALAIVQDIVRARPAADALLKSLGERRSTEH